MMFHRQMGQAHSSLFWGAAPLPGHPPAVGSTAPLCHSHWLSWEYSEANQPNDLNFLFFPTSSFFNSHESFFSLMVMQGKQLDHRICSEDITYFRL